MGQLSRDASSPGSQQLKRRSQHMCWTELNSTEQVDPVTPVVNWSRAQSSPLQRASVTTYFIFISNRHHGRPHIGANGVSWPPPGKMDEKLRSENMQKSSFLCLCYILIAIRAGRCRERRYADHIFIQIYFRMHHFAVKFLQFSLPQAARGHWPPNQNPADVSDRHCSELGRLVHSFLFF